MLKYLVILLDDASVSFCHYNIKKHPKPMDVEILRKGILFGMKENLTIQFVYPQYELPQETNEIIETIDHTKIKPLGFCNDADVIVCDNWVQLNEVPNNSTCVVRSPKSDLWGKSVENILNKVSRLNVVITDIETFRDDDFKTYKTLLAEWSETVKRLYLEGKSPQLNVITDRMMLDEMNNCGAGDECLTLAPDGRFYVCPAFYQEDSFNVGDVWNGLNIKNKQLYRLDHAPICRHCDAYQCKRCIWLNRKTTLEVNTPSHEQCVVAHLERETGRTLLAEIREHGMFLPEQEISEIDYYDPFDKREEWQRN